MSTSRYLRWAHSLAATVCELVPQLRAADVDQVSVAEATRPLDLLVEGAAPEKRFEVRGVRIGTDWMVMGVNAEAVADYALWLRGNLADRALMLAGCMDDTYGYLPTDRMIDEGGYEGGSFCPAFGLDGVRVGGEAIARSALSEVATSLRTPSEDPSST